MSKRFVIRASPSGNGEVGMTTAPRGESLADWLAACVWVHAGGVVVHSAAHVGAGVWVSALSTVYIWLVIILGPLAGIWLQRRGSHELGVTVVFLCMLGALGFGILNHFVWHGIDHVQEIAPGVWRSTFQLGAVGLSVTEVAASVVGISILCATRHHG